MSSNRSLEGFLLDEEARPLGEAVRERRHLLKRLLLAELLSPPPALRERGERTPLSPLADSRD